MIEVAHKDNRHTKRMERERAYVVTLGYCSEALGLPHRNITSIGAIIGIQLACLEKNCVREKKLSQNQVQLKVGEGCVGGEKRTNGRKEGNKVRALAWLADT